MAGLIDIRLAGLAGPLGHLQLPAQLPLAQLLEAAYQQAGGGPLDRHISCLVQGRPTSSWPPFTPIAEIQVAGSIRLDIIILQSQPCAVLCLFRGGGVPRHFHFRLPLESLTANAAYLRDAVAAILRQEEGQIELFLDGALLELDDIAELQWPAPRPLRLVVQLVRANPLLITVTTLTGRSHTFDAHGTVSELMGAAMRILCDEPSAFTAQYLLLATEYSSRPRRLPVHRTSRPHQVIPAYWLVVAAAQRFGRRWHLCPQAVDRTWRRWWVCDPLGRWTSHDSVAHRAVQQAAKGHPERWIATQLGRPIRWELPLLPEAIHIDCTPVPHVITFRHWSGHIRAETRLAGYTLHHLLDEARQGHETAFTCYQDDQWQLPLAAATMLETIPPGRILHYAGPAMFNPRQFSRPVLQMLEPAFRQVAPFVATHLHYRLHHDEPSAARLRDLMARGEAALKRVAWLPSCRQSRGAQLAGPRWHVRYWRQLGRDLLVAALLSPRTVPDWPSNGWLIWHVGGLHWLPEECHGRAFGSQQPCVVPGLDPEHVRALVSAAPQPDHAPAWVDLYIRSPFHTPVWWRFVWCLPLTTVIATYTRRCSPNSSAEGPLSQNGPHGPPLK